MRSRVAVLLSTTVGVMLALVVLLSWPTNTPLSILNNNDEGLSTLYSQFNPIVVLDELSLRSVSPKSTLLLVATKRSLNHPTVRSLIEFAERGGIVIASVEVETVMHILASTPTTCIPRPYRVYDPILNVGGDKRLVKAFIPKANLTIVLESPYVFLNCSSLEVYAVSSTFSYVDLNENGFYDTGDEVGSAVLGVSVAVGEGRIVLLASPTVFTNKYIGYNRGVLTHYTEKNIRIAIIQSAEVVGFNVEFLRIYLAGVGLTPVLPYVIALAISGVVIYVWQHWYPE